MPRFPLGSRVQRAFWWFAYLMLSLPLTIAYRWRPGDGPSTPRTGGYLLLSNHASVHDPFWIAFWIMRRSSFMTSAAVFRMPVLNWLLPLCGCFPKEKFVRDRDSMRTLAARYEAGDVIVLFPEGTRTFDGRTRDALPGIGRLVKRLDAQVVCARIQNGHLFQPRWATYPRWVPVRVVHDPVRSWDEQATPEQITADVSAAIRIDPDQADAGRAWGFRMAHGLPNYLWACPVCFEHEGLQVTGANQVNCRACGQWWRVDANNNMHGQHPMRVHRAWDRIVEHALGIETLSSAGALYELNKRKRTLLAEGTLELGPEGLRLGEWFAPWSELKAVSVEIRNTLTVRHDGKLIEVRPKDQSPLKWAHFLDRSLADSKGGSVAKRD